MRSSMSSAVPSAVDDGVMSTSHPRAGGPRRRAFTPRPKLAHLEAYEQARDQNEGGAYLRREGLYSSLITGRVACVTPGCSRASRPVRVLVGPARTRLRSPGCVESWRRPSSGWAGPRRRWRSWEKHARSWKTSSESADTETKRKRR